MTRRLIISGTREELSDEDRDVVLDVLARSLAHAAEIGVGDCRTGIDALVREAVDELHRGSWRTEGQARPPLSTFIADWDRLGKRAGPERNARMVAWAAETDRAFAPRSPHRAAGLGMLLAFPGPRSRGTWDCVRRARAAGLSVGVKRVGGARW